MIPVVGFVLRRRIHPRLHLRSQARLRLVGGKGRGGRGLVAVSADEKRLKSTWVGKDVWVRLVEGSGRTSANPCSRRNSSTPWSCDARGGAAGDAMLAAGGVRGAAARWHRKKREFTRCRCSTPSASRQPRTAEMPTHKPRTGNLSSIYKRGWPIPISTLAVAKHVNCKSIAPCARTSKQSPCPSGLRGRT